MDQFDMSSLSPADQQEIQQVAQNERQRAQVQASVHHLSEVCFAKCVPGKISTSALSKSEETCAENCVNRWIDTQLSVLKMITESRSNSSH